MRKTFNITGDCKPELHYMVNIEERLRKIRSLIDRGEYITLNRARQYGKTTTLRALTNFLQDRYIVISIDFQTFGDAKFRNENVFSLAFTKAVLRTLKKTTSPITEEMTVILDCMERMLLSLQIKSQG